MPKVPAAYAEARTREITDAAYRVFARRGFAEATMQEIADEAGLSVGALYQYFDSKDDMVIAAGTYVRERHAAMIDQALAGAGTIEDVVRNYTRTFYGSLADPEYLYRFRNLLSLWAEAPRNERIAAALRETTEAAGTRLAAPWEEAQDGGRLQAGLEPRDIIHVSMAIREGLAAMLLAGAPIDLEGFVRVTDAMLLGLLTAPGEDADQDA